MLCESIAVVDATTGKGIGPIFGFASQALAEVAFRRVQR